MFTQPKPHSPERSLETILVAEDETALREKIREVLEAAGYRVLVSKDVDDAIQIVTQHKDPVDLLLTDVVMPKLSGPELAMQLQPLNPRMKVLYMSGYPDPNKAERRAGIECGLHSKTVHQTKTALPVARSAGGQVRCSSAGETKS